MDADSDIAEKINELLGVVAALKAYVAHLPGAAEVDLDAVRRAGRDTGSGLIGGVHPSTHVSEAVDDIHRMASAQTSDGVTDSGMRTHSLDSPIASEIVVHGLSESGGRTTVTYNDSCPLAGKQARAGLHLAPSGFPPGTRKAWPRCPFQGRSRGMRQLVMELVTVWRRRRVTALALLVPLALSAAPASAQ